MYPTLTLLCAFVLIYSLASRRIESWPVNGAFVFVLFGFVFGSSGFGWLHLDTNVEGLSLIAELTLAVMLFSDAARVNFPVLIKNLLLPIRLLWIGLPLTILLGFAAPSFSSCSRGLTGTELVEILFADRIFAMVIVTAD